MANVFAGYQHTQKPGGGFLAPRVSFGGQNQAPALNPTQSYQVRTNTDYSQDENKLEQLSKYVVAAPVDIVDSTAALFGVERGATNAAFWNEIGQPGMATWVERNAGGLEVAAGLAGAVTIGVAAEFAAAKVATSAWFAATGIGRAAAPVINMVARAQVAAKEANLAAAASGNALRWTAPENLTLVGAHVGTSVAKAATSEIAIAAAMNKNTFIWSDDASTNLWMGALGIVVPGIAGGVFGRAAVYKWANGAEMRLAASEAVDPAAFQRSAQMTGDLTKANAKPTSVLAVSPSYLLTQYSLDINLDDAAAAAKRNIPVGSTRSAVKIELSNRQKELAQQIAKKGIDVVPQTSFGIADAGGHFTSPGKHVAEALADDPTAFLGLRSLGVAADPEEVLAARLAYKERVTKKAGAFSSEELEYLSGIKHEVPMVMVGKTWLTVDEGLVYARHKPNQTIATKLIAGVQELTFKSGVTGKTLRIREDGRLINAKWDQIDIQDVLSARDAMRENMIQLGRKGTTVTVPKDAGFIELDYAVEFEKRGGKVNYATVGVKDAAEARLKSLQLKAAALKGKTELSIADRIRFNLPRATSLERIADAESKSMLGIIQSSAKATSIEEVERLRKEITNRFDLTTDVDFNSRMDGDLFNFGYSREGTPLQPLMGFFREVPAAKWSRYDVQFAGIEGKTTQMQQLLRPRKSKFVAAVTSQMLQFPGFKAVADVTGLMATQIGGTRNIVSSVAASALTQAQRFRNNPTLLAAQQYKRVLNRVIEQQVDDQLKLISPLIERITSPASTRSKIMFDSYMSLVPGWDIKSVKQIGDGTLGFVLDHESAQNLRRFGKPIAKGTLLTNPRTGAPVVLDELGNQTRIQWEKIANDLLDAQNSVRQARGLNPREKRKFYAMPKSTRGKYVAFTLGPDNRVVEGGAIVAATQGEYNRMAAAVRAELKPGQRLLMREEIARFADLWDQADMDFIDPTSMAGPGGKQSGSLASEFIDATSVERMLTYIKEGYENLGNGITRTLYSEQLKLAEVHSRAAKLTRPVAKGTKDIHEIYMETLLGMPSRMNPTGAVQLLNHVDNAIDAALESWYPDGRVTNTHLRSMMDMAGYIPDKLFAKNRMPSFSELAADMADYMPFKTVNEYAEYTLGLETPWKSRELARKVNQFGTAAILRWGEIAHSAMNMAGIITNMPGLVGAKNVPLVGTVNGAGIVDTTKIMARGFKRMLAEGDARKIGQQLTPDYEHMVKNGDATQQAAEFDIAFGQLKPGNHSGWHKFMFGDPSAEKGSWKHKGIDGAMSILTDTSESMSRRWAHFVGLELADYHGVTGIEARHTFARQVANDAIANYDAWNRPEIYQNALGSMYGLFLSYAQNYYQRLWSFMEVGDYNAMGRTLALQSAMFGFAGMPGFRQLSALLGGEEENNNVMDGIYERFGPHVGSIVAQGGFNQLTTIFGLPAMALHTRGDVNFRHPSLDFASTGTLQLPVGLEVIKDLAASITESMAALGGNGGARQAAEVMARHMPSRVLSGAISVLGAGGDETDAYGNVVSETQNFGESMFRLLGVRSARQQGEVEAYFMNQRALQIDAQRMDEVRKSTRAMVRAGNYDNLPKVFEDYLEAGGKPWNYTTWIRGIVTDAAGTRGQNQLLQSMRSPGQQDLAHRIELMTAGN